MIQFKLDKVTYTAIQKIFTQTYMTPSVQLLEYYYTITVPRELCVIVTLLTLFLQPQTQIYSDSLKPLLSYREWSNNDQPHCRATSIVEYCIDLKFLSNSIFNTVQISVHLNTNINREKIQGPYIYSIKISFFFHKLNDGESLSSAPTLFRPFQHRVQSVWQLEKKTCLEHSFAL